MIRLNFTNDRKYGEKRVLLLRLILFVSFLSFILVSMIAVKLWQKDMADKVDIEIARNSLILKRTIKRLKKGNNLKKSIKIKEKKIAGIDALKGVNKNCLTILRWISSASNYTRTRLSELKIERKQVIIEGFGYNTEKIASFIERMKVIDEIKRAHLKVVEKSNIKGYPKLKFIIICKRKI